MSRPGRADGGMLSVAIGRLRGAGRRTRTAILIIFVVSIAVRVLLAAAVRPVLVSDGRDYYALAESLAAGRGYSQVYEGETEAFAGFTFRAFRSPGYPALMAALYSTFGWRPAVYLATNIAADVVTEACGLLIGAYLFGAAAGVVAQVLLAAHVLWTVSPMTESVYAALFAALALMLVLGVPLRRWRGALGFGLLAAAALFVRPVTLCVWPALAWKIGHEARSRRGLCALLIALAPSVLGVSLWAWRNYGILGAPVLFTTNYGHHNAEDYGIPADLAFARLRAAGLNEAEINAALIRDEMQIAGQHPFAAFMTWVTRVGELFSLTPAWELENVLWQQFFGPDPQPSVAGRLYRWSYSQYYLTYAAAGAAAAWLVWRRRKLGGLGVLMLSYVAVHALISRGDIRLAAPLYPLMCVLAASLVSRVETADSGLDVEAAGG